MTRTILLALALSPLIACGVAVTDEPDAGTLDDGTEPAPDAAPSPDDAPTPDPDAEVPACPDGGVLENGVCTRYVPCLDAAPDHATSTVVDVPITYDGAAWSEPAACAWTCNQGCASNGQCVLNPADIGYNPVTTGSRWFGGDDRDLNGDGEMDIRSVGAGESFVVADPVLITRVRLGFATGFYSAVTGAPHEADVTIELRADDGTVLARSTQTVSTSFTGGWLRWDLDTEVPAGTYLLTAYAPNVFAGNNYTAGTVTDYAAGYAGGVAYVKELADDDDGAMGEWTGWQADPGVDHAFSVATACPAP
jgi:hypothetical protein